MSFSKIDKFSKACGGEYEKSLVGRLGAFGDKVSETKLVKNSFVDKMKSTGSTIKRNIQAFIDKHPMLSAMDKTPTKPENSMPKKIIDDLEVVMHLKHNVEKQGIGTVNLIHNHLYDMCMLKKR